jgi:type VI secretion system secreted protein VgrG
VGASGSLVARYDYDPYGKRITQYQSSTYGGGGCEFGYTGHVTVPSPVTGQTEIVLTHFRPYDPELGRWLSADPLEKVTGEMAELLPEGSNLYSYIGNSPMNGLDPLGLLNPAKCLSSIGNAANASRLYAAGMTKLAGAAGLTSTGAGAPAGVGAAVWGGWNISAGMSAQKRGMQQWSEAFNEEWSDASWKNLLGVLPFGTEGDDPCEPSLWDVYKSKARNFSEKPLEFLREFGTFGF